MDPQPFLGGQGISQIDPHLAEYSSHLVLVAPENDSYEEAETALNSNNAAKAPMLVENPYPLTYLEEQNKPSTASFQDDLSQPSHQLTRMPATLAGVGTATGEGRPPTAPPSPTRTRAHPSLPSKPPSLTSSSRTTVSSSNASLMPEARVKSPVSREEAQMPQASTTPPPKKRRPRKGSSKGKAVAEDEDGAGGGGGSCGGCGGCGSANKRSVVLERNRVAALKCRKKKKNFVSELEEQRIDLESQHSALQSEYTTLLGEATSIKTQLMDHASCNDPQIDKWLDLEARRFIQTTTERYRRAYGTSEGSSGFGPGVFSSLTYEQLLEAAGGSPTTSVSRSESVSGSVISASATRRVSLAYSRWSPSLGVYPSVTTTAGSTGLGGLSGLTVSPVTSGQTSPVAMSFPLGPSVDIQGQNETMTGL